MKEEMEKLMQEEKSSFLQLSCLEIEQELDPEITTGSFSLDSVSGKPIKGKVLVSDPRISVQDYGFTSEHVTISYSFDSSCIEREEEISGFFVVLTNFGEYEIPFRFSWPKQELDSSLGEIKNLFHFTNLARSNWQEALNMYFSDGFEEVLQNAERKYRDIYRALSGKKQEQYMDEFLHAIHKKTPVTYEIDKAQLQFTNIVDMSCENLEIQKKGWGYVSLGIKTEGDFLSVEKEQLTEHDFLGNVCKLSIYIDVKKLHMGKNWGEIIFFTPYESFTLPVLVSQNQHHRMAAAMEKRKNAKWLNSKLTNSYIHFRSKKMGALRFKKEGEEILEALQKGDERNPLHKLYGAHLYITQEKHHEAKWLLDRAWKNIQEETTPIIYAYYLYLTTLITEDKAYVLEVKEKIQQLYYNHDDSWQIAWLWMYLSKELHGHAQKKWEFLKEVFMKGCTSPVMYTEAMLLLNYQPTLLMELGEVELRILRFGQKKGMLSEQIKGIIQYLSFKEKEFSLSVYKLLTAISKEEENVELLQAICSLLIKGNKIGPKYFVWYEKAILAEIKITRLYEYYMMSLDQEKKIDIPRMVLLYFSYQNDMTSDYAAYLYRYVYENKEQLEDLYYTYAPGMERYLVKKLHGGVIDPNLGYLYEQMILPKMMTEDNAKALAKVMFTHALKTKLKAGEKWIVLHSKLQEEDVYLPGHKNTYVQIYDKDYIVLREDRKGNRFLVQEAEQLQACTNIEKTAGYIRAWVQDSYGLALYLCDGNVESESIVPEKEPHLKFLSQCEKIQSQDRQEIRGQLMEFYYVADWMEKLDACLEEYIPFSVSEKYRNKFIHYLVVRGYARKAYDFVRVYGPQNIQAKDLVRISSQMLEEQAGEEEILLWYIYTAFKKGKYDTSMLQYLVQHFKGSSKQMRDIFKAAMNFELDTFALSERILTQILFTKAFIGDETEIFKSYVAGGPDSQIEVAFLTYRAVEYMRDDRVISTYLILDIGRVFKRGCQLPLVTRLAYLRYFAENKEARREADETVIREFLQEAVIEKEMLLPFIQEYLHMPGMEALADKTLISYKTAPKRRVMIHYLRELAQEGHEEYHKEEMKEVYFGVYVKEFVLFYGEKLQYYITEEQQNQEQLTGSGLLQKEEIKESAVPSRYQMLNEMSLAQNLEDYGSMEQMVEEYWKTEFVVDKVFHL
ncbi:MAG: hypothetical protein IKW30_03010 [Lachnospiraceae bacterium]|nr:hypothetical protein [Lachnospiraceae bacterium]